MLPEQPFGLEVSITVKNIGSTTGSEVIQVYVAYPQRHLIHPKLQLKGFAKARDLRPGSSTTVTIKLDKYAVSYWDESSHKWVASAGEYGLFFGTSCDNIALESKFEVKETFSWLEL